MVLLGPLAIAALAPVIGAGSSGLINKLFGGSSGGQARGQLDARAQTENELLKTRQSTLDQILDIVARSQAAFQADPTSFPTFQLPKAAGGPANDLDFLQSLRPMKDIELLLQVAGLADSGGGSGIQSALLEQGRENQNLAGLGDAGEVVADIITQLLAGTGGGGGSGLSGPGAFIPPAEDILGILGSVPAINPGGSSTEEDLIIQALQGLNFG
jgi:hypothetical protein